MGKSNFRFVSDSKNQNVGLKVEEIDFLQNNSNLRFPQLYISFLQSAGANSNVFQVETNADILREIQNELRSELDKLGLLKNEEILCIRKDVEFIEYFNSNFETYYFFNLSENKEIPELYYFEEVCINEGWLAFKKQIRETKENNFVAFINCETERKYGFTPKQHLKNILLYIISIPLSLILLIILGFQILKEKIKNK
jgi:hypothetical protein